MTQLNDVAISTIEWKIQFNSPFERLVIGDSKFTHKIHRLETFNLRGRLWFSQNLNINSAGRHTNAEDGTTAEAARVDGGDHVQWRGAPIHPEFEGGGDRHVSSTSTRASGGER